MTPATMLACVISGVHQGACDSVQLDSVGVIGRCRSQ